MKRLTSFLVALFLATTISIWGQVNSDISKDTPMVGYYSNNSMDRNKTEQNLYIDYLALTDENCYINTERPNYVTGDYKYKKELVNNGPESMYSRHTIHTSKTETDPRTRGKLKTVPDDERASVRLGNWNNGGESERVEYTFVVDANRPILLLKYAVVLESPGHDKDKKPTDSNLQDPRFTLKILGINKADERCISANFNASWTNERWTHDTLDAATSGSRAMNVVWKDWTTIGVNLSEYIGQNLTVQLTTYDCGAGGHFGYAYFTLGCDKADIIGNNCGRGNPITELYAPSGFYYKWYRADDPWQTTLSTEQTFFVDPMDTCEYAVDNIYKEKPECSFTVYTSPMPNYPIPDFTYQYQPKDCKNEVVFINNSRIAIVNQVTGKTTYSKCKNWVWEIQGKDYINQQSLVVTFPQEGGRFPVALRAISDNGGCDSIVFVYIDIPQIGDTELVIDTTIQDGYYVEFGKYYAALPGLYHDSLTSIAGCDSIITLNLHVVKTSGKCGDNLYWSYAGDTLSITGTGDMYDYQADSANAAPWVLFRDSISMVVFPEGITYIGTHAFRQLPLLTDVTIPNAVEEIGESAFAGCAGLGKVVIGSGNSSRLTTMGDSVFIDSRKLYEIHIAATEPPIADHTTFLNYNVHLYVPCESKDKYDLDMVFGDFKYIECLDTDTPVEDFAVTPAQTSAQFVWGAPSNAATYTLDLQQEDTPFFTLVFNATGQLHSISLAPIGSQVRLTAAEKAGNGFTFNATGLTARTLYNYDLTIRDAAEVALQNYSGYFYTTSDIPTGTEDISADDTTPRKVFRDGQVYILRNGKTYTLTGEEVE